MGKTTIATKFPKHVILGFEKGWSTIPGAMAEPINSWGEFRKKLKELKDPEVQEMFETVIIDTADIAYDYCEKYIMAINGVDSIGEIPYGQGYGMVAKEFDECLRSITQMNYGLVIISHSQDKTFTDELGREYNQIVPTLGNKGRLICQRMCDIIGYSRGIETEHGVETRLFMRGTPRFIAGSRFKYTPDHILFTHKDLVNAIGDAIDQQMKEYGVELFTDERVNTNVSTYTELDFDNLIATFQNIVISIPGSSDPLGQTDEGKHFIEYWNPRISQIVEKYLGKGRKVNQCTRDQVEALDLIVSDLQDIVK